MLGAIVDAQNVLIAVLLGYLLGALPFAHLAGRVNGVDIFSTGNTQAGTANVFWNVGRRTGALVFVGDLAKGAGAVMIAGLLDVSPPLVLAVGAAALVGHWMSVFTGFRGGDGMAPLMGVALALAPPVAAVGAVVGLAAIVLMRRSSLRSTWGICVCFLVMPAVSQYYQNGQEVVWGLTALAALVLVRSNLARWRRVHLRESTAESLVESLGQSAGAIAQKTAIADAARAVVDADPELPDPVPGSP